MCRDPLAGPIVMVTIPIESHARSDGLTIDRSARRRRESEGLGNRALTDILQLQRHERLY